MRGKPFKKGHTGFKPKGAENKTTQKARELFLSIMEGETENIKSSFDSVRKKNPALYLMTLSKFYPYFIPKKIEISEDATTTIKVVRE